jgi:SAM-dependent methyltransferase
MVARMVETLLAPLSASDQRDFVAEYVCRAPLALALERSLECQLYVGRVLQRPILDVGCGDGCFAEVLLEDGQQIDHGLDLDGLELARARQRGVYGALHQALAQEMPYRGNSMATILSNSAMEHMPPLDQVLAESFRVLRPGGVLCITVPTDKFDRYPVLYRLLAAMGLAGAAERFRQFYNPFWRHYHFYSQREWRRRLSQAGFEVHEVIEYGSPARCTLHDFLVPFALPLHIAKKLTGHYIQFPWLRRLVVQACRGVLPQNVNAPCPEGTGGLIFLRATKPLGTSVASASPTD